MFAGAYTLVVDSRGDIYVDKVSETHDGIDRESKTCRILPRRFRQSA